MSWFNDWFSGSKNNSWLPSWWSSIWGTSPMFNDYAADSKKLEAVLTNPAMLKVIKLQCDLFSLGKIYLYKGDTQIQNDPLVYRLNNPNPFQPGSQFLWDMMFWTMIGNAYLYVDSEVAANDKNKLYFLEPRKMDFPTEMQQKSDHLVFSDAAIKEYKNYIITYRYQNGTTFKFPFGKVVFMPDLTNGTGNWFKGNSVIDALYKVIDNSEASLDANNINTRYSGKFLVAGQADPNNVQQLPLGEDEKKDIESKMNGDKKVHAVKSMIEIKRFVENMGQLKLNENYLAQYFVIGNMYGIPRDVLEAYQSSTYENQEKARASHVSYTLQPKGDAWMAALTNKFSYIDGRQLVISWDHLPFVQVFEKERAGVQQTKITTLQMMLKLNIPLEECNKFLDTDFKTASYEQPKPAANTGANQGA